MEDRWGSSSSASSWTSMEYRWGSSSSASSWTSMEYRWGSSSSLPAHGLKWRQIKSSSFAPHPRGYQLKMIQNQAPLPLFFMHINEDEDQAPLPLHEISKNRSASSSTASSWTPIKIRMNLKPWEVAWMGSSWRKKRIELPWQHGKLVTRAFKVWFSQRCSSIFFCFWREICTILWADLNFSSVCLGDFPPSARRIRIPDEAGCLGFRGVHAYKARGCFVCISWCMRTL